VPVLSKVTNNGLQIFVTFTFLFLLIDTRGMAIILQSF
jgi:hypothetical protein